MQAVSIPACAGPDVPHAQYNYNHHMLEGGRIGVDFSVAVSA